MTDKMRLEELQEIIRAAGGKCWALSYAKALLEKINRLEAVGGYARLFAQLRKAKDPGDFRGRLLEVNFADLFVQKSIELQYGAKQGMAGDVDFCWCVKDHQVFIEMKHLGQDKKTKDYIDQKLNDSGCFMIRVPDSKRGVDDDLWDVARIQLDIVQKSTTRKFNPKPVQSWVNLVAVDVSELQLGTADIGDCLLAAGGNELAKRHCHSAIQRPAVVGVFEPADKTITVEQADWVKRYKGVSDADTPHPRDYIHGVLFLFREPEQTAALSYELSGVVVWNPTLIDGIRAKQVLDSFHQIVPRVEFKTC